MHEGTTEPRRFQPTRNAEEKRSGGSEANVMRNALALPLCPFAPLPFTISDADGDAVHFLYTLK